MEVLTAEQIQQKELDAIDAKLQTLWKECLLSDIDCRIIASCNNLVEKKVAIDAVIISRTKEEAAVLTECFRNMAVTLRTHENATEGQNTSSYEENHFTELLSSRNPFLNNMIIKHLFGFLPLQEMKRYRLVCREWNSASEICLRKRSAIHFLPKVILPNTFIEVSKYSHPNLPFPSFIFSNDESTSWDIADIQNFMEKWEKNIKEVTFKSIQLTKQCNLTGTAVAISDYCVTPLFINPSNITSLTIIYERSSHLETILKISLEKFMSLKSLSLICCTIIVSPENQSNRIAPLNISLQHVSFIRNGKIITHFCYNDIFDFSRALNIQLNHLDGDIMDRVLQMHKNVFKVNQLILSNVYLENWAQAVGEVQFLHLQENYFVEQNQLTIKKLEATFSKIDVNALPQSLESFEWKYSEIYYSEPVDLPKLKSVSINIEDSENLIYFSNCANLVELSIFGSGTFSLGCIPKSVKRITMEPAETLFPDECVFEVDTLILDCKHPYRGFRVNNSTKITAQIKAKVLVVVCGEGMVIDTSNIVELVLADKQSEEILIGSDWDLHENTPFMESDLSKYVDKKSNYYQFRNGVGKSLTQAEFKILCATEAQGIENVNYL